MSKIIKIKLQISINRRKTLFKLMKRMRLSKGLKNRLIFLISKF